LIETWIIDTDKIPSIQNYVSYTCPAEKLARFGRGEGRTVIYVRRELVKYVKHLETGLKHSVFLLIDKALFGCDKDVIFGVIYVQPYDCVKNPDNILLLEDQLLDITSTYPDNYVLLTGDFNSRTADEPDSAPRISVHRIAF
jgi:hypothetical protein